jgi:hypothetical protein
VEVKLWLLEARLREHRRTLETLEVQLSLLEERLPAQKVRLHAAEGQPKGHATAATAA